MTIIQMHWYTVPYVWKPDASRTVWYYDFEDSNNRLKDTSWNNNNLTDWPNINYETVWWQTVAVTTATRWWFNLQSSYAYGIWNWNYTMSCWIYFIDSWAGRYPFFYWTAYTANSWAMQLFFDPKGVNWLWNHIVYNDLWTNLRAWTITASWLYNWWHNIVVTRISWTTYCYIDANLDTSFTDTGSFASSGTWCLLSRQPTWAPQYFNAWAKWDKFILEKVWWTAGTVEKYYNWTKDIYEVS